MHSLRAEVFFVNVHLWDIFPFHLASLPAAMFALLQLSHVCGGIIVTRSSNFVGSYNIVKFLALLMTIKLVGGQFSSMSRVCRMVSLSLSISRSGHGGLGIGTHPKSCWDGASNCVGTRLSHASVMSSTLWQCSEPRACWLLLYLYLLQPVYFPGGREILSTGKEVSSAVCWRGCCSHWAILFVNRRRRHNINHTENEVWIS